MDKVKVGVIGCGNISSIYFENLTKLFRIVEVVACADLIPEKATEAAEKYDIPKACSVEELLADPEIKIVLNLTIPASHYEVCKAALLAGKSVHVEKPLSITREQGKEINEIAKGKGLLVGCAPDTFMGAGIQTCRKLIDDGWIGRPIAATAFMTCHGHESWHPDPEFYYKTGGGPMFDMGPYYLTALVSLMGAVDSVSGMTAMSFPTRTITSAKKFGNVVDVEVATHIAGLMKFKNGAIGTIITSFDVWGAELPYIEIYGTEGTIRVPDPNTFGGPVYVKKSNHSDWHEIPMTHIYAENSRGIGVADMAYSIQGGRKNRANGDLGYHVLDIMHAFHDSSNQEKHVKLESSCERPAALSQGLIKGFLDN